MNKPNGNSLWHRLLPVILIAGLPMLAVAAYSQFYAPDSAQETTVTKPVYHLDPIIPPSETSNSKIASVSDMTTQLAQRLKESPDDPKGWLLLAKSYEHINDIEKARDAYTNAMQYGESDTELEKRLAMTTEAVR